MTTKLKENHGVNKPCKRNFLKENMENITKLKKDSQNKENEKLKNTIKRIQAGGKPRFLWRKRDFNEVQCQCDPFCLADHDTQTYRMEDETFMEGTKVIFPSTEILKAIREDRERKFQENLNEQLMEKRKFDKTDDEVYLDSLTEFLDTGAVSKRKKLLADETAEMDRKLNCLELDAQLTLELLQKKVIRFNNEQVQQTEVQDGDNDAAKSVKSVDLISEGESVSGNKESSKDTKPNSGRDNGTLNNDSSNKNKSNNDIIKDTKEQPAENDDGIIVLFQRSKKIKNSK